MPRDDDDPGSRGEGGEVEVDEEVADFFRDVEGEYEALERSDIKLKCWLRCEYKYN
jgi:hypothetical protein